LLLLLLLLLLLHRNANVPHDVTPELIRYYHR